MIRVNINIYTLKNLILIVIGVNNSSVRAKNSYFHIEIDYPQTRFVMKSQCWKALYRLGSHDNWIWTNCSWIIEQRSNRLARTNNSRLILRSNSGKSNESSKHSNESKSLSSQNRRVRARELDELLAKYNTGELW